jgi:hypothetical protein
MMEYRGARMPVAGYRPNELPDDVSREWQKEFGKARNQILGQVLPSIQDAEAKVGGRVKPGDLAYERIREVLNKYDSMAARHATNIVNRRHLSAGKLPRRPTVRELSTKSEVE